MADKVTKLVCYLACFDILYDMKDGTLRLTR